MSSPMPHWPSAPTIAREHDEVLARALRIVVLFAEASLGAADGASVSLELGERLVTVAATNDVIAGMDADQYRIGEGPCVSAARFGEGFLIESIENENRWPSFVPLAAKRGIGTVISTPLSIEGRPVGALNIYARASGAFALSEGRQASSLARAASGILLAHSQKEAASKVLTSRIASALVARENVVLAQGILMEREGVTAEQAHGILRRMSRASATGLVGEAARTVATVRVTIAPALRSE